jgi:F-type H+-transporting ATPase subunit b
MLSHLLLFAAAEEGSASQVTRLMSDFGIDVPLLFAQIVSFCVVAFLLWKFAFKPVLATIEERQRQIASGLQYAEETKARLAQTQEESAAIIKQAKVEGTKLIEDARKVAKEFAEGQQQEAVARANEIIAKAEQAIASEHKKMLEQARLEVARLSDSERARYNEAAAREITVI